MVKFFLFFLHPFFCKKIFAPKFFALLVLRKEKTIILVATCNKFGIFGSELNHLSHKYFEISSSGEATVFEFSSVIKYVCTYFAYVRTHS